MKKKLIIGIAIAVVLIAGLLILTIGKNKETAESNTSSASSSSSSSESSAKSTSKEKKKRSINDTEQDAVVYWGTKGNFEEYDLVVPADEQSKDIIKRLIAEIAKHANYDIEMKDVIHGNNDLTITFADSFNPDEETANKIYDSIYETCYRAFHITHDYFFFANSDEMIERAIGD